MSREGTASMTAGGTAAATAGRAALLPRLPTYSWTDQSSPEGAATTTGGAGASGAGHGATYARLRPAAGPIPALRVLATLPVKLAPSSLAARERDSRIDAAPPLPSPVAGLQGSTGGATTTGAQAATLVLSANGGRSTEEALEKRALLLRATSCKEGAREVRRANAR